MRRARVSLVRATVERVLVKAGRAVGVEGWALDSATGVRHAVVVHAPLVIVAAGAIETPALLKRSGLTNPNIGRHLRLHPVAVTGAFYEEPVEALEGVAADGLLTPVRQPQGRLRHLVRCCPAHPGMLALATPWGSGVEHKSEMRNAAHEAAMIVLARDTGEGHITLDRQGDPILHYWPSETDRPPSRAWDAGAGAHRLRGRRDTGGDAAHPAPGARSRGHAPWRGQ